MDVCTLEQIEKEIKKLEKDKDYTIAKEEGDEKTYDIISEKARQSLRKFFGVNLIEKKATKNINPQNQETIFTHWESAEQFSNGNLLLNYTTGDSRDSLLINTNKEKWKVGNYSFSRNKHQTMISDPENKVKISFNTTSSNRKNKLSRELDHFDKLIDKFDSFFPTKDPFSSDPWNNEKYLRCEICDSLISPRLLTDINKSSVTLRNKRKTNHFCSLECFSKADKFKQYINKKKGSEISIILFGMFIVAVLSYFACLAWNKGNKKE